MIGSARLVEKSSPDKAHRPIYDLILTVTLAGAVDAARRLLALAYGRLPPAKRVATALSTHALDGLSLAAGFGDVTRGAPSTPYGLSVVHGPLEARVAAAAQGMMARLTADAFVGEPPTDDAWRERSVDDPWRAIVGGVACKGSCGRRWRRPHVSATRSSG